MLLSFSPWTAVSPFNRRFPACSLLCVVPLVRSSCLLHHACPLCCDKQEAPHCCQKVKANSQQKEAHQEQFLELGMQGETQELEAHKEELCQAQHQTSYPLELAHASNANLS